MEKKNEKLKTMVLFLLMFTGINYSLFTFLVQPKMMELEKVQASYERGGESQGIYDALMIDRESLNEEIAALSSYGDRFNEMVQSEFDTLQLTYDFYSYAVAQDITGVDVRYDISAITAYAETIDSREDLPEENPDEEDEAYEVIEISDDETVSYLTVSSGLNLLMDVERLEATLDSLPDISSYHLYPYEVILTAEEADTDNLAVTVTTAESTDIHEDDVEIPIGIALTINYNTYLQTGEELSEAVKVYEFYEVEQGHSDLMNLFAPSKEVDISTDIIEETESNLESESGTDTNQ